MSDVTKFAGLVLAWLMVLTSFMRFHTVSMPVVAVLLNLTIVWAVGAYHRAYLRDYERFHNRFDN